MTDNAHLELALDAALKVSAPDGGSYQLGAHTFWSYLEGHVGDDVVDNAIKNALLKSSPDFKCWEDGYDTFCRVLDGDNKFSLNTMFKGLKSKIGSATKGSRKLH